MRNPHIRTIARAGLAVLACGALVVPAAADAKKPKNTTKVTIVANGGDFSGKVKHKKDKCIAEREVTVYSLDNGAPGLLRLEPLTPDPSVDTEVASDTTDDDGRWNTGNNGAPNGVYYAHTPASGKCKAGTSKTVTVTGQDEEL